MNAYVAQVCFSSSGNLSQGKNTIYLVTQGISQSSDIDTRVMVVFMVLELLHLKMEVTSIFKWSSSN